MTNYQPTTRRARTGRRTGTKASSYAGRPPQQSAISLPDIVSVAVAVLAAELGEGLLASVVGTALPVCGAIVEEKAAARWPERVTTTRGQRHAGDRGVQ